MSERPSVRKTSWTVPVSDEAIVDYGLGTIRDQQEAARRLRVAALRNQAMWLALPLRVRIWRRLVWRLRYR